VAPAALEEDALVGLLPEAAKGRCQQQGAEPGMIAVLLTARQVIRSTSLRNRHGIVLNMAHNALLVGLDTVNLGIREDAPLGVGLGRRVRPRGGGGRGKVESRRRRDGLVEARIFQASVKVIADAKVVEHGLGELEVRVVVAVGAFSHGLDDVASAFEAFPDDIFENRVGDVL
jgi:hypothetical protein